MRPLERAAANRESGPHCLPHQLLVGRRSESIGFSRAVVRWRRIDLARVIEQRYGVKFAERSVGDLLRRLGFRRISVRPQCPEQDAAMQETHKKTLAIWSRVPSQRTDLRDLPEHNRKRNASMPLCAAA
jgi:hypothetical protein